MPRSLRLSSALAVGLVGLAGILLAPLGWAEDDSLAFASATRASASRTALTRQPQRTRVPASATFSEDESPDALLAVQEAGVLRRGLFEGTALIDNYDRDPLGLDVVDGIMAFRIGVARALELRMSYEITRSVSSPGMHPVPAPPLDIVVLDGPPPTGPYRAVYWPMPFLRHSPSRVDEMVPGEYTLGLKGRLFRQNRWRPAVALVVQVTAPGDLSRKTLAKGSGSGGLDAGVHAAATWRYRRLWVSANVGGTLNSAVVPGDQIISAGAGGIEDVRIRRPAFLHNRFGSRLRVWRGVSMLGEAAGWMPVGGHTAMQSESGAADVLGGVQLRFRNLTFTAGVREHLKPQENGRALPTGPLAGAVDLSGLSLVARASALDGIDVEGRRPDANLVVLGWPSGRPLPDGALRIPATYPTSTTGNAGFVFRLSLRLGS